jgi:hypothetical protein
MLNYSSVAHLSNQFRKTTGLSASEFKALHLHQLMNTDGQLQPFADGDGRIPYAASSGIPHYVSSAAGQPAS